MSETFQRIKSREGKDLSFFTGLYYNLTVKSIPNGIVTFEPEPRHESNLIQFALNDLEDFETISVENPDTEGPFADRALWTLLPELSSGENDYQFKVLSHPDAKLTYTHGSSWGGRYMELDRSNPENYNPAGTMYTSSLWYFRPSELPDYVTIHNSDPRRNPNFVTFSNEPSERGQLMQLGTKDLERYAPKGPFRQDTLWLFKPKNYQLFAFITNFKFEEPSERDIADFAFPLPIIENTLDSNNPKLDFTAQLPEIFKLKFLQSFKPFSENNIEIDSNSFTGKLNLKFLKGKPPLEFQKKYGSNTQFQCERDADYNIQQQFSFPNGISSLKVTGFCSVVKDLEIPFTATVKVTGKADCADSSNGLKISNYDITSNEVIEYLLKHERFNAKTKKPSGKDAKKIEEGSVECEVSGILIFSCGLDTYVDVK